MIGILLYGINNNIFGYVLQYSLPNYASFGTLCVKIGR